MDSTQKGTIESPENSLVVTLLYHKVAYFALSICFGSTGDNILAVLKHLVMSEKLADASDYRHGNMVFFDLLGIVVVAYPARVGTIINCIVMMTAFFYLGKKYMLPSNMGEWDISKATMKRDGWERFGNSLMH